MDKRKRRVLTICLAILAGISVLAASASMTALACSNRVLPNTYIAGVSVGFSTFEKVADKVSGVIEQVNKAQLEITLNDQTKSFDLNDLGISVDSEQTKEMIGREDNSWDWLSWSYWRDFFRRKQLPPAYTMEADALNKKVLDGFGVSDQPINAQVSVQDNQLVVVPHQVGLTVDQTALLEAIEEMLSTSQTVQLALQTATAAPVINTELATQTKTEIEQTIKPIYLTYDSTSYALTANDLYNAVVFEEGADRIGWEITEKSLQEIITSRIVRRINVRMASRTVKADTNEVIAEGKEGKEVQVATLAQYIYQAMQKKSDTANAPIQIPVTTIAITDKTVYPSFVAGMFPGKYIDINLSEQKLYLIDGNVKIAEYRISSGKWSMPTPKGVFYIASKNSVGFSSKYTLWMPWWNGLAPSPDGKGYLGYGIHELPCFDRACTRHEGESHLGTPISHGCVRLGIGDAETVYNWAPVGTPVNIH